MLHHVSFSLRDPGKASWLLAELVGGTAISAPTPPFPEHSWFVVLGDSAGSLIELMPWGTVQTGNGIRQDPKMRPHSASHVLMGSPLTEEEVLAIAAREGLPAQSVNAGLFGFVKVWIEDSFLLELLTPEHLASYVAAFGVAGAPALDGRLRQLEQELATTGS